MQDTGSNLPRRRLGHYLMDWRTRAGLSLRQAAELLGIGQTTLYRLEHGQNDKVNIDHVEAACELYGVPDLLVAAFTGLAKQQNVKSWWHEFGHLIPRDFDVYFGLESSAVQITTFQPELVPGLFQTADYVRALNRDLHPGASPEQHEGWVQLKMKRQHIVTRKRRPTAVDAVIGEAALRRVNGGPKVMAGQLKKIADMSTLPNVELRVLPFQAGFPTGRGLGPCVILDFETEGSRKPVEPPVVFIEGSSVGNLYLEKPEDIASYYRTYDSIRQRSLDAVSSRNLLRQVAKEYLA
ncbi:helix-turn-helix domain-containing protein [Nocardia cyriacigeorgica]|uniref:helix-turn-helix domain-containing protein n=1 Tax=Nocardia cyriacigeorgica TaxID=135487 RepID=UPI001895F2E4|nr:helix-turn-helix transcriptional regulator [Nocardia cyriacigeorgica]MBF6087036.1 helix-turn-helix domain-containing protein [Nocardia cyriacigeorgica]MBF6093027.1 helix-turn-helix domain-containing protein [Nocardia cyriacigeorgica]MBF6397623.1 helix-turn-helix domain-containing protein [Nocardia cyriacigeorgica]MBF6402719.1 helix-turn-helix domain-containing protein [Nocardia cyriacigeorgica]MBF6498143.1 helix-turn-helix domain-containing protein [Nocardia cyriacigeorgica]